MHHGRETQDADLDKMINLSKKNDESQREPAI